MMPFIASFARCGCEGLDRKHHMNKGDKHKQKTMRAIRLSLLCASLAGLDLDRRNTEVGHMVSGTVNRDGELRRL